MTSTLQDLVSQPYRHVIYVLQKMKLRSPQTVHDHKFLGGMLRYIDKPVRGLRTHQER
jgi:hypothetical protein